MSGKLCLLFKIAPRNVSNCKFSLKLFGLCPNVSRNETLHQLIKQVHIVFNRSLREHVKLRLYHFSGILSLNGYFGQELPFRSLFVSGYSQPEAVA